MSKKTSFDPDRDCGLCPRLKTFIDGNRVKYPDWHNAPVDTWAAAGDETVRLLIVGLAPGLKGANRTGRPFTGDFAGDLLYATLSKFNLTSGNYGGNADDGLELINCAITNAVRCVPPQNKPVGAEINQCRPFLQKTIARFEALETIITLGKISHDSTVRAMGGKISQHPFGHELETVIDGIRIISSYHCSRYNTNTGRLTEAMFENVFRKALDTNSLSFPHPS
ncbi:MAG: uracil-DNA glycosylase [Rhizobiaceae bacterium]|nr:uracil-DNA glycosylase [Rhizobiaceae bacterium]